MISQPNRLIRKIKEVYVVYDLRELEKTIEKAITENERQ